MSRENRGRSIRTEVRIRAGQTCLLKKHFRDCLGQVVGYLDVLAGRDPERFVWCGWQSIARQARKWKDGGKTYSRTRVFFCLKEVRDLGIVERATRVRNGCEREGFLVKSHDILATNTSQNLCVLSLRKRDSGEAKTGLGESKTGLETGLDSSKRGTPNGTANGTEKDAQSIDNKQETVNDDEFSCEVSCEVLQPLSLSALSREPCKENLVDGQVSKKLIDDGQAREKLIGEMIDGDSIYSLSDGEFEEKYLANYPHTEELKESCRMAVQEMEKEPYQGRLSHERVMYRAMEILKQTYGHNVPRGWVPVMKALKQPTNGQARLEDQSNLAEPDTRWEIPPDCPVARLRRGEITQEQYDAEVRAAAMATVG